MDTERSINAELLAQFDSFLQKPLNMSGFMAEMARLYDITNPSLQSSVTVKTATNLTLQQQYSQFLLKLNQDKLTQEGETQKKSLADKPSLPISLPAELQHGDNLTALIPPALANKTILVAEDNRVNQKIAKKYLEKMGYSVIIAENGQEAITLFQQNRATVALILMDCQMPVLDGLEATRLIRANQHSVPIIALTANDSEEDKIICLKVGMDGFLTKPLTKEKITEVFNRFMI